MGAVIGFGLLPVALCLAALLVGVSGARRNEHLTGFALMGAVSVAFGLLALTLTRYGQHTRLLEGVVIAALGLGVVPQLVCHFLGFWIGIRHPNSPERRRTAIIVSLIATGSVVVPVSFLIFIVSFTLTACNPGQSECPFG
jgi:ABC-type uncharacterized transport system permease subunit